MSKPKKFLKGNKKGDKQAPQDLTADEYLANGVDFEEAGEKWRAGDAAKSMRFFGRAVAAYDEGLTKYPKSFDLAYNKARIQFDVTQYPTLLKQLEVPLEDLLRTALDSSRVALSLRQDNDDALFNTAQVLTSLAESITEVIHPAEDVRREAMRLLEESVELFQRTLTLQEFRLSEMEANQDAAMTDAPPSSADPEPESVSSTHVEPQPRLSPSHTTGSGNQKAEMTEEWAEVIEPVTNETLLDTALSQLQTLTTLCSIITHDEGRGIAWIEEYSSGLLNSKIPSFARDSDSDREGEVAFSKAKFLAALAEANFRNRRVEIGTYARGIEEAFGDVEKLMTLAESPEVAVSKAEAYVGFNAAVRKNDISEDREVALVLRWKALTMALELLTAATKAQGVDNVAAIHMLRGDVELLRFQMGNGGYEIARKSEKTLAKNAGTYYRGAAALSTDVRVKEEAMIKEEVAKRLEGSASQKFESLGLILSNVPERAHEVLEGALEDGLVTVAWLRDQQVAIGD